MLAAPSSPLISGVAAIIVAAFFLSIGFLVADALLGRRVLDNVIRLCLALPGFMILTLALMLLHIVSGGAVLSNPWITRAAVALTLALLVARKVLVQKKPPDGVARPGRKAYVALAAVVIAGVILWGFPATQLLPLDRGWDTDRDGGYASQLLNGESTPSATVTGEVPNDYPWMHAASTALLASFTPGGRALSAHVPLFFIQVLGAILALYGLGWELTKRLQGGVAAALFGALSGGFGYLISGGPAIVLVPRANGGRDALTYLGDMLFVRSYNMSFNNLAPAFPRDLGFSLLAAFLLLLVLGFSRHSRRSLIGAGVVLGMVGLTTGESMPFGLGAAALLTLAPPPSLVGDQKNGEKLRFTRRQVAAYVLGPALGLGALWVAPVIYNYFQLGGFRASVNTPVILTPLAFLGSWGLTVPFALYGAYRLVPEAGGHPGARIILATLLSALALLLLPLLVPLLPVPGFDTLSRSHRYWPLLYLPVALYAAVGASRLEKAIAGKRRRLALSLSVLAVILAVPSPLLASIALPDKKPAPQVLEQSLLGKRTMLNLMAPQPGMRCVASVPPDWSHAAFAYTGYRLILFRWTDNLRTNSAHVRWRGIYERIPTTEERNEANNALLLPLDATEWKALANEWGVNVVTVPRWNLPSWVSEDYDVRRTSYRGVHVSVVWVKPCR
jgi:hypothetical protein